MDYLHLIKQHYSDKIALIIDSKKYTYRDIIDEAERIRINTIYPVSNKLKIIKENNIFSQLINFIALSGTKLIPLIVPMDYNFNISDFSIPKKASMAVVSSGTTGKNKVFFRSTDSWASFFKIQNSIFNICKDTNMFMQGSLSFTGNLNLYMCLLSTGACITATNVFDPRKWNSIIDNNKVNAIYLIPTKLKLLCLNSSKLNNYIKTIVSGSQLLGLDDAEYIKETFSNSKIILYYGASELNYITYIEDTHMTSDKTIVGRCFPNVNVSIKNNNIYVDTPYGIENIKNPFKINDCGFIDDDNMLHLLGRNDDIYNINGVKVSSIKVENALLNIEGIKNAAVIIKKLNNIDILTAYIQSDIKWSVLELKKKLQKTLNIHELPKRFVYKSNLPLNESGKVIKYKL